jgi:CRISPR-associated protein Csa3
MKTLISNLRGQCLFDASVKTQADGIISLHEGKYHRTEIDSFIKGGEILLETDDPKEVCERISEVINGAKKHGEVFVACSNGGIGSFISFVANKNGVDGMFTCFKDKIIRIPLLKLDISKTKLKIIELLYREDLSAVEIVNKIGISRAMVYKHLNDLIERDLVKRSSLYEKYSITKAGVLVII